MDHFPGSIPVLPIRNTVLFPTISMPLVIGRGRSLKAIEKAMSGEGLVLVVTQKQMTSGDPDPSDLNEIGTLAKIDHVTPADFSNQQVMVSGISRYRAVQYKISSEGCMVARGESLADSQTADAVRSQALFFNLKEMSRDILNLLPGTTDSLVHLIDQVEDPSYLSYICASYLNLNLSEKQELLETSQIEKRIELLLSHMQKEREVLGVQREIRDKMSERLNKAQREALLREQIRTIRTELGEEPTDEAADEIEKKLKSTVFPDEVGRVVQEELKRLRSLPATSVEYHVIRSYLEWLAAMPWNKKSQVYIDIQKARETLDADHYGLEKVKRRILQYLSVAKLKNDLHGPILCLIGPPGVGKTSLGQSIARALGRKFIRTSLGGLRDEAEIRGHRRTYVGAMPGRIVQSIKRVGTRNPVMMLDEIDKLHADFHGDPAAAMLEVLDPEQNRCFRDHYLDVPFDLSDVFFITTANIADTIPFALRDRTEIIEIAGYTLEEKFEIARRYLIPKLLREHGLKREWVDISDETIRALISDYTREAGVRELERKTAALFRAAAEDIVARTSPQNSRITLSREGLCKILGGQSYFPEIAPRSSRAGVVTGLSWTPHGGELLFVEVSVMPKGKGMLILTGQLGDVMKESAQIALSLVRSSPFHAYYQNFDFSNRDIHVHVPAGAIPKDGPSAGVTTITALMSFLTNKPVNPKLGMTGEITLRGAVLKVGGIKEKLLAAYRSGLETIILPQANRQDLLEVPKEVRERLKFIFVDNVEEALAYALSMELKPRQQDRLQDLRL